MQETELTPRQIVAELDKYIVGQHDAKRAVAVALRNRYRRSLLVQSMQDEVTPKNILMIGPTGVGKTEIARRLAKLVRAPFIKVEATKFTEVGYVGRDVESIVRDLVETSIRMVKLERMENVKDRALKSAEDRLVHALVPDTAKSKSTKNPLEMLFQNAQTPEEIPESESLRSERGVARDKLRKGLLEDQVVELDVEDNASMLDSMPGVSGEQFGVNLQEMLGTMMPKRTRRRKLAVREARKVLEQEEAQKLLDMDEVTAESIRRAEQFGIVFIDEVDKIAGSDRKAGADVSREGVQRDILPIVEGSTVVTKHGPVKTDHMLFIAAGAFHMSKPSDLIPELQGRFPIRVELKSLTAEDFRRILTEPENALLKQYVALLGTEDVTVEFRDDAIERLAELAATVNEQTENIGARRLHTLLERMLEDLSFEAPDVGSIHVAITSQYVDEKLANIVKNRDLSQYIL